MIHGIGTDIVCTERIEQALARHGERFARRILTAEEWHGFTTSPSPARLLARRFAAKEAAAKAFGTGFSGGLSLQHIATGHDTHGRPELRFSGHAETLLRRYGITTSHLSLSDDDGYAVAFAVLER